jgi:autotransporter passenger strand-loop-strand repeat protein
MKITDPLDLEGNHRDAASPGGSIVNTGTLSLDQVSLDALNGTSYEEIVAWGDSLTAGNEAGVGNQYPTILAADFDGTRTVLNEGKGGQTSTQIAARLIAATTLQDDTEVIWAGGNNCTDPTQVMADIASMVAALGSNTHYVILSLLNGSGPHETKGGSVYNDIIGINNDLAATYPGHYLDVRSILVSDYNPAIPTDVVDYNDDVVPSSLRVDDGHLNAAGNTIVAQAVENFITTQLDGPLPPTFTIAGSGVITTAATTLNLAGFDTDQNTIETTNTAGTTFTVDNTNTAMHVFGGPGFDILVDKTTNLTSAERTTLYSQGIEEVVEASGSYLAPGANPPPMVTGLLDDTGLDAHDGITDQIDPTIIGTAFPDSTVQVYIATTTGAPTLAGTTTADSSGNWSFQYTAPSDEIRDFSATETIGSGTASLSSNVYRVTIDTTPPGQPSVLSVSPDTSSSSSGAVTTSTVLKYRGTAEIRSQVEIFLNGEFVGTTEAKGTGAWVYYDPAAILNEGINTVYVIAEDVAGNFSIPSATFTIDVGTDVPPTPAVGAINGLAVGANGDYEVRGGGVILTGTGVAGDTVSLSLGSAQIGTAVINASGQWTFDYSDHPLATGSYSFGVTQTDSEGAQSASDTVTVQVSTAPVRSFLEIAAGDFIADITVAPKGTLQVDLGAVGEGLRVGGATATDVVYGATTGTRVRAGGLETVESGGTTSGTTVASGGAQTVLSGGVATGTIIYGGATETVQSGGVANNIWVKAGGALIDDGSVSFLTTKPAALFGTLSGSGTLTEQGGGEFVLAGDSSGFVGATTISDGTLVLSNVTLGGTVTLDAGTRLRGAGEIEAPVHNLGVIIENGGVLEFARGVSGAGTVLIDGGTVDFGGAFNEDVRFTGSTGVLELSQAYAGRISGLSKSGTNSLDIADISYAAGTTTVTAAESATATKLTITSGAQTATITLAGNYEGSSFTASSDGHGGTTIVDPTPTSVNSHALVTAMASFTPAASATGSAFSAARASSLHILATPSVMAA